MNRRSRGRAAAIGLLVFGLVVNVVSIATRASLSGAVGLDAVAMFPLPMLGALLVWKKPSQPIGWIMLGLGTAVALTGLSDAVGRVEQASRFVAGTAQALNHVSFAFMVGLFGLLLALFPTGNVASPRWRVLRWLPLVAILMISLSGIFGTPDDALQPKSPLAVEGAGGLFEVIGGIGLVMGFLSIVGGGLSVITRARFGDATQRAQIKWFAFAVAMLVVLLLVGLTPVFRGPDAERLFDALLVLIAGIVMPACIAIAVLKHRLYDIDLVVNRALVYGGLTAILGATYLLIVVLLQRFVAPITKESDLAVAASTLAVAGLFRPVRSRVQSFIDQRFYRRKYDAVQTLNGFSAHLREQVDLDALVFELATVVGSTMQPAHVSVWLKTTEATR